MAIQLPPGALIHPDAPPIQDMIDAVENRCAEFVLEKGNLPEYVYLNSRLWQDIVDEGLSSPNGEVWGFIRTVMLYGLEPVTHEDIPYGMAGLYDTYLEPSEVAKRLKAALGDLDGYESRGLISIG